LKALEQLLVLFAAAAALAAVARRLRAPPPVFLALGGAVLALLPIAPSFNLPPELALALFVAPVLVDSGYDMSLRDLRDNWAPIAGLVICAVGLTTAAVAAVAHALAPGLPWAAAVALGAIVAPPDAVAATAVLRQLRPPHRIIVILEGESLLNDASALLIYRLALGAVAAGGFSWSALGPAFLLGVAGSLLAGFLLGRATLLVTERVRHIPTAIILQFVLTFGVWIAAEGAGLSAVLTTVCFAVTLKRAKRKPQPARLRLATNAVWTAAVFALNILAFVFIGLQIRPIVAHLDAPTLRLYAQVSGAVLATTILVRIAWHMSYNSVLRWHHRRHGFHPARPMMRPTAGTGFVISWAGMRGIVTLAAAMALPADFPQRGLAVFAAFSVTLGTLLLQGLTLRPLLRHLDLHDGDPVGKEIGMARRGAYQAGVAALDSDATPDAEAVRDRFKSLLSLRKNDDSAYGQAAAQQRALYAKALDGARRAIEDLRARDEIGDDAFIQIEQELDWLEMVLGDAAPPRP